MRIYFAGIGGVGIGPLAEIALDAGFEIIGSDKQQSPITKKLLNKNVKIYSSQDGKDLQEEHHKKPIDWFIYTSALPKDHPEIIMAKKLGIKQAKRDELLSFIIKNQDIKLVAVAGTHGKTSTTGLLVWAMKQLSIPISYSVGTTLNFAASGCFDKNSQYFIYECDEFDRNFLNFNPWFSLITALDYDHPDTYKTKQDYFSAFKLFLEQSNACLIWQKDYNPIWQEVLNNVEVIDHNEQVQKNLAKIKFNGIHSRENAFLVLKFLTEKLQISQKNALSAINSFPGVDRRFEKIANNVFSDYGHHPKEIAATIQMAREVSNNIVLVYQPHQNIRQHEIRGQYTNCMLGVKKIYWLPTYLSREDPNLKILTPKQLYENLINRDRIIAADMNSRLKQNLEDDLKNNSLVLFMGAGSIDNWARKNFKK